MWLGSNPGLAQISFVSSDNVFNPSLLHFPSVERSLYFFVTVQGSGINVPKATSVLQYGPSGSC